MACGLRGIEFFQYLLWLWPFCISLDTPSGLLFFRSEGLGP